MNDNNIVNVIKCPHCSDMWIIEEENINENVLCQCFRCDNIYFQPKPIKMWLWVYNLCKKVKGS